MAAKVTIELSVRGFKKLADYLSSHEADIAWEENDFGMLRDVFITVFEEEPSKRG